MEDDPKRDNQCKIELQRKHLWDYFELHANQRITLFRYYTIILALFVTSAGVVLIRYHQQPTLDEAVGIVLSIVFLILTLSFYLIDRRNRQLIHYAETAMRELENECVDKNFFNKEFCIFTIENRDTENGNNHFGHTHCFKMIYWTSAVAAISLLLFSVFSAGYNAYHEVSGSQSSNGTCHSTCRDDSLY